MYKTRVNTKVIVANKFKKGHFYINAAGTVVVACRDGECVEIIVVHQKGSNPVGTTIVADIKYWFPFEGNIEVIRNV